jgi:hypothetical protein
MEIKTLKTRSSDKKQIHVYQNGHKIQVTNLFANICIAVRDTVKIQRLNYCSSTNLPKWS